MQPPIIKATNVVDKRWSIFFFSYTILSVEDSNMQHTIQFGIQPFGISIDGTASPSINISFRIWKIEIHFGLGRM